MLRRSTTAALVLGACTALKPPDFLRKAAESLRAATSGAPPPPMQAFLAGASPQAQREVAALQDAFPVGASEDVQLEWRAFEQVFAGRQASGSSETAWAQQEAFELRGEVYALEPHVPDQLVSAVRRNGRGGVARLPPVFPGSQRMLGLWHFQHLHDHRESWRLQFPVFPGQQDM